MKAAFFLLVATAAAQNQTGGVAGVVVDSVSRQPVKKATVSLNHMGNPTGAPPRIPSPPIAITDASGTFAFENAPVGQARITVQQANYPPARSSTAVKIKAGEIAGPVTIELIPGAVITGRVLDEDGEPLSGCFLNPHPGGRIDQVVAMQAPNASDINGEYRIFNIPPGKYTLSIQCQTPVFEPRPFSAGPDPPPTRAYPPEYYPAATESNSAETIDLAPGTEKSGVDFQMKPTPVTQVRGTFAGDLWRGRENLSLLLIGVERTETTNFGISIDSSKGTFEFHKVFPGSYLLAGYSNDGEGDSRIGVFQRMEVKDQPVETVLEWRRAMDISGTVQVETQANQTISPKQISIQLIPDHGIGLPFSQAQVQEDGSFTLKSVLPAVWRIQAQGPGVFVKSAWMGNDEATDEPLDLTSGAAAPLRIVVSSRTATVRGTGPAGQMIFAQRIEDSPMPGRTQGTRIDPNGQFTLNGLAPGKYRLTLADPMMPIRGGVADESGKEVTVKEGETVTVDLKN